MGLDILCAVLVAAFCILGILSGFLTQIVRFAALVGAFFLAYSAGAHTKLLLVKWIDLDNLAGDLLSLCLGWVAAYLAIVLIGTLVVKIIRKSSTSISFLDRVLGGALGSAKGFLIVYLIACALVLLRDPLDRVAPQRHLDLKSSRLAAFAEQHNVFSKISFPELDRLRELTSALNGKKSLRAGLSDPVVKELRQNEAFQRLMDDKTFHKALADRQLSAILNNPSFRAAVNDPQIRKLLSSLDLERLSEAVDRK